METHGLTVEEIPAHTHAEMAVFGHESTTGSTHHRQTYRYDIIDSTADKVDTGMPTDSTGGDNAHSLIQPVVAVYGWRRTA